MRKAVAVLLALCFVLPVCLADEDEWYSKTLSLEEKFEISTNYNLWFDYLFDDLDFKGHFYQDAEGFLAALSEQPLKIQKKVIFLMIYQCRWYSEDEQFNETLATVEEKTAVKSILQLIDAELTRTKPDYKELFTRRTDAMSGEKHGIEMREAFEYDTYAFIARLSLYGVKWQLMVCSKLASEYSIAEDLPVLEDEIAALRKDKRKKTFLFEITLDNMKNAIIDIQSRHPEKDSPPEPTGPQSERGYKP